MSDSFVKTRGWERTSQGSCVRRMLPRVAVRQPGATECGICSQGYAEILWEMGERVAASARGSRSRTKRMFVSMQSVNAFRAICLGNHFFFFCLIWHRKCIVSH